MNPTMRAVALAVLVAIVCGTSLYLYRAHNSAEAESLNSLFEARYGPCKKDGANGISGGGCGDYSQSKPDLQKFGVEDSDLCGVVLARSNGEPIPGARVSFPGLRGEAGSDVIETDRLGRFCVVISTLDTEIHVGVTAAGFEPVEAVWTRESEGQRDFRLVLSDRTIPVRLHVIDSSDGQPIGTVSITVSNQSLSGAAGLDAEKNWSDLGTASGYVSQLALLPGEWEISVESTGYASETLLVNIARTDNLVSREVALRRKASIAGIVFDEKSGRPIGGAWVGYTSNGEPDPHGRPFAEIHTATSGDGEFSLVDAKQGRGRLFVVAEGYAMESLLIAATDYEFVPIGLGPETVISGVFYRADGRLPAPGSVTLFNGATGARTRVRTDAQGAFQFRAVKPGSYSVLGESLFGRSDQCDISVSKGDANIECNLIAQSGRSLHVELVNVLPENAVLEVWIGDRKVREVSLPGSKIFTVYGLAPGDGFVRVRWPDGPVYEYSISLSNQADSYVLINID